jgi:hypothetical protein
MSYSFRLPEEDSICECKYDEVRDRMDREDCPFHCDMADDSEPAHEFSVGRKPPTSVTHVSRTVAADKGQRGRYSLRNQQK